MEIADRVAVVTGAARGIGRATAIAFAEAGARGVVLADLDVEGLAEVARAVEQAGARALAVRTDVADPRALAALLDRTEQTFGAFHVLHNNAGLASGTPTWPELSLERIGALVDVNLKGVLFGTRLGVERLQRSGGGAIVNTASMAAHAPLPPEAVYCATKAAVVMFTRSCAPLRESHRVRVNCVCPGITDTPMIHATGPGGRGLAAYLKPVYDAMQPLAPEAIAAAVLALVADDAKAGEVVDVPNAPRAH